MRLVASFTHATGRRFGLAAAVVVALGAGAGARADMTETFTYNIPYATTPFNQSVNLNLFNTNLGVLTGVNIQLTTTVKGSIDIYNFTGTAQTYTNAFATVATTVTGPGPTTVNATASATSAGGTVPGGSPFGNVSVTGTPGSSTNATNVASAEFALYEAVGNHTLTNGLTATAGYGMYGGTAISGVAFTGSAQSKETIVVTYTYTHGAVPAPASLVLLGTGLIPAVGAWIRRRRSVA